MVTPNWMGATPNQPQLAAQVNQLLGTHQTTFVYAGVEQDHQATAGSGAVNSNGLWIAEQFTPSSNYTTGRLVLVLSVTGSPAPLSIAIYSNASGTPGALLAGPVSLPAQFVGASAVAVTIPMPGLAVSSGTSYWIVAQAVGDASDFYLWSKANGSSGAATSTNGTTWTTQAYNLLFQVWDNTTVPPVVHTLEDSGSRWTYLTWNLNGPPASLAEYTVAQGTSQYVSSNRTLTYSNNSLITVA